MVQDQTYYVPRLRRVFGPDTEALGHLLFALYLRYLGPDAETPRPYSDGASTWIDDGGRRIWLTIHNKVMTPIDDPAMVSTS